MAERLEGEELAGLLRRAREGDVAARNRVVEANMDVAVGVVRWLARTNPVLAAVAGGADDMLQQAAILMLDLVGRWDAGRGASFRTFARRALRRDLRWHRDWNRGASRPERRPGEETMAAVEAAPDGRPGPPELAIAAEELARIRAAFNALPARDRELMARRHGLDGRPPRCEENLAYWMGTTPAATRKYADGIEYRLAAAVRGGGERRARAAS